MTRRSICAISLAVASVFASEALYAAPTSVHRPVYAMFAKSKLVKFSLRNDSASPLKLKVGEDVVTLDAGKTQSMELPVGTRIVRQDANGTQEAGALVTEVSKNLSGTTIALKG